jgi:hypothetical protein
MLDELRVAAVFLNSEILSISRLVPEAARSLIEAGCGHVSNAASALSWGGADPNLPQLFC